MTHRALLGDVWGHAYEDDTHTLRVHIANLRRKIEPDPAAPRYIRTDTGVGYRFMPLDEILMRGRRFLTPPCTPAPKVVA